MNISFILKFLILCSLSSCTTSASKTPGCLVELQSDAYKNKSFYLASHFGTYQTLLDTVAADIDGRIVFKKKEKYLSGIYMLVNDMKEIEFEFLMDETQHFKIEPNAETPSKTIIYNSPLNIDFRNFNVFLNSQQTQLQLLQSNLETTKAQNEKEILQKKIETVNAKIIEYKQNYIASNSNTLALFFKLTQPIDDFSSLSKSEKLNSKKDSISYLKTHYFDGLDFNDPRLLRNPFLESKISTYFDVFVPNTVDAITKEITVLLDEANTPESEMFKYMSLRFMDLYGTPKKMGHDRIFLNLYTRYFKSQTYAWLPLAQQEFFNSKARRLEHNQIGSKAKELFMNTMDGKPFYLNDLKADYIVLVFWDPTCGHCQTEIPRINQLYTTEWKTFDLSIYAVNMNSEVGEAWEKFISTHGLNSWNHVAPAKEVSGNYSQKDVDYQTLYNVEQTPEFYLLDKNKTIIAKDIDPADYLKVIERQY